MADSRCLAVGALRVHLMKSSYSAPLNTSEDVLKLLKECYPTLDVQVAKVEGYDGKWVIVCCAFYAQAYGGSSGPVKPARMVFHEEGHFMFEVLAHILHKGQWKGASTPYVYIMNMLDTLLANSGYLLCPGIANYSDHFAKSIRFRPKNVREWGHPTFRYDAHSCILWHKPNNSRISSDSPLFNACSPCKSLFNELNVVKKRADATSPSTKEKRTEPSSNRPFKYLSPNSQTARLSKNVKERHRMKKCLVKIDEEDEIELKGEQKKEIEKLTALIEEKHQGDLEAVFDEASK